MFALFFSSRNIIIFIKIIIIGYIDYVSIFIAAVFVYIQHLDFGTQCLDIIFVDSFVCTLLANRK